MAKKGYAYYILFGNNKGFLLEENVGITFGL